MQNLLPETSSAQNPTLPSQSSQVTIFIQDACYQHRYIRSKDVSNVFERPERLKAVKLGLSAAVARLELEDGQGRSCPADSTPNEDELAKALDNLELDPTSSLYTTHRLGHVDIFHSTASLNLLGNAAVKFVHGDIDGDVYLEKLISWAKSSSAKITDGQSEIPEGYNQGDLYLCPESINAIQGALGTTCEAVDLVMEFNSQNPERIGAESSSKTVAGRAFVAIRPPGHHCGEDTPSGFCFVNNVAVAAAHAHLKHGVTRVVIFDIDLHHGNGTQSIVWGINEDTYRQELEAPFLPPNKPRPPPGLKIFYGSLHDVLSYPCEDGKPELIQAASVSINGPHGQFIENIHMHPYESEQEFWNKDYKENYSRLFVRAEEFLAKTDASQDKTLVFISCGFDANIHEHESMSRHGCKVPPAFYHVFARDAARFADEHTRGRLVSVLEGGYSDRALISGAMAHLCGLVKRGETSPIGFEALKRWWDVEELTKLEKLLRKKAPRRSLSTSHETDGGWLTRTMEIFAVLEPVPNKPPSRNTAPVATSSRILRDRKIKSVAKVSDSPPSNPTISREESNSANEEKLPVLTSAAEKRLPKVVLKLGPRPTNV